MTVDLNTGWLRAQDVRGDTVRIDPAEVTHLYETRDAALPLDHRLHTQVWLRSGLMVQVYEEVDEVADMVATAKRRREAGE